MSTLEPIVKPDLTAGADVFPEAYDAEWVDTSKITEAHDRGALQSLRAMQITLVKDQNRCIGNAQAAHLKTNMAERMVWNACAAVLAGHIAGTADAMHHIASKYKGALKKIRHDAVKPGVLNG